MLYKLLNGDLLCVETATENNIEKVIAADLNVHPTQVKIVESCILIEPFPIVRIPLEIIFFSPSSDFTWLETCVNDSILDYFLRQPFTSSTAMIFANPHTKVVEKFFTDYTHTHNTDKKLFFHLSGNPADEIVDYLIAHPEKIVWERLKYNTNVKAQRLMMTRMNEIDFFQFLFVYQRTTDISILQKMWEKFLQNDSYSPVFHNDSPYAVDMLLQYHVPFRHLHECPLYTRDERVAAECIKVFEREQTVPKITAMNPCTTFVEWFLADPHRIEVCKNEFNLNTHQRAVEYLLTNEHMIDWSIFVRNANEDAVTRCIDNNLNHEIMIRALTNPNPRMTRHAILSVVSPRHSSSTNQVYLTQQLLCALSRTNDFCVEFI